MMEDRHLSLPPQGQGPGVLVLHEARGLTDDMVWAAKKIAEMGYVAIAPDLVGAMRGPLGAVFQLIRGSGPLINRAAKEVDDLLARPEVVGDRVGVVGFSMGAALALLLDRHLGVAVLGVNYGMIPPKALQHRQPPLVASFGGSDRLLPRGRGPLDKKLGHTRSKHDIEEYPSVGHSFMTPTKRPESAAATRLLGFGFDENAAEGAWRRLRTHFNEHLPQLHPLDPDEIDEGQSLSTN